MTDVQYMSYNVANQRVSVAHLVAADRSGMAEPDSNNTFLH